MGGPLALLGHRDYRDYESTYAYTADNCGSKREGFAGRDYLGAIKSLPRTANPNREKSGPRLGFLGSGRNLKSLPFGLRNYRLLFKRIFHQVGLKQMRKVWQYNPRTLTSAACPL